MSDKDIYYDAISPQNSTDSEGRSKKSNKRISIGCNCFGESDGNDGENGKGKHGKWKGKVSAGFEKDNRPD